MAHEYVSKVAFIAAIVCTILGGSNVDAADVIDGQVVDRDGESVPNAVVEMLMRDPQASRFCNQIRTVADEQGRFQFDRGLHGMAVFTAYSNGYAPGFSVASVDSSTEPFGPVRVILCNAGSCEFRLKDERGQPIENARVISVDGAFDDQQVYLSEQFQPDWDDLQTCSDADGALRLKNLPSETKVAVTIRHNNYVSVEITDIRVNENATAVDITLKDGVAVELVIDGLDDNELVAVDLRHQPFKNPSTIIEPARLTGNTLRYVVEPGDYSWLRVMARRHYVTPLYSAKWASDDDQWFQIEKPKAFHFDAIPTASVSGRVIHAETGEPLKGVYLQPSLVDAKATPDNYRSDKVYGEPVDSDSEGRFTLQAPIGRCRIDFEWIPKELGGFIPNPSRFEIDVSVDGADLGDWSFDPIPPVRGQVFHADGTPAENMLVRFRGPATRSMSEAVLTSSEGRYTLPLRWMPVDLKTKMPVKSIPVVAIDLHSPAAGMTSLDASNVASFQNADIKLEDLDPWWPISAFVDQFTVFERGEQKKPGAKDELLGTASAELTAAKWWNVEQPPTLESLRGRWVLLDYYFTNCGPCQSETAKLIQLHNAFAGERFALIGVHIRRESIKEAAKYIEDESIPYPVFYCDTEGRFEAAASELGVEGYPSYVLLDPEGRVVNAPLVGFGPSLRNNKLEVIRALLLTGATSLPQSLYAVPPEQDDASGAKKNRPE